MTEEDDVIMSLISSPFSKRSEDEQKRILSKERPIPQLNLQQKDKSQIRTFNVCWYAHHKWLAGSESLQRLFCWPCLLLATDKNKFSWYGYTDLKNLSRSTERHGSSKEHLMNVLSFRQLLNQDIPMSIILNDSEKCSKEKHNHEVKVNREIFKKIVDATCLLTEQFCISSSQEETEDPLDDKRFKSLLELLLSYEEHLLEHYKSLPYFLNLSKSIIFEIIQCVNEVIKGCVGDVINKAPFYSVMVDDASEIMEALKCSVYVRLIDEEGILNEYFLGFHDMDKTPDMLASTVKMVLKKFEIKTKMVSLSFDGAVLKVGGYSEFENIISQEADQAILSHCFAYKLTYILQQVCWGIEGVKSFFATIQGIPLFFYDYPDRMKILNKRVLNKIPFDTDDNWTASSKFLEAILSERLGLIETFQHIATSEESNAKTIREAESFRNKLDQTDLVFLLLVFKDLFAKIENLDAFLRINSSDTSQCWESVLFTISELDMMKTEAKYNEYVSIAYCGKDFLKIENGIEEMDIDSEFKNNYFQILDYVKTHLVERFSNIKKLSFMVLGDISKVFEESDTNNQVSSVSALEKTFGHHFNKERLKNELETIFSPQHRRNFETKYFLDLIQNMVKSEYNLILPEVYKMLCLLATIPYHQTDRKACFFKKFRIFSNDKLSMQNLNALARLFYEREILAKLKKKASFYETIIDKFAKKEERKINLLFKR